MEENAVNIIPIRILNNYKYKVIGIEVKYEDETIADFPIDTFRLMLSVGKLNVIGDCKGKSADDILREIYHNVPMKLVETFDYVDLSSLSRLKLDSGSLIFKHVNNLNDVRAKAKILGLKIVGLEGNKLALIDNFNTITIIYQADKLYLKTETDSIRVTNITFADLFTSNKFNKIDMSELDFSLVSKTRYTFFDVTVSEFIMGKQNGTNILEATGMFRNFQSKKLDLRGLSLDMIYGAYEMFEKASIDELYVSKHSFSVLKELRETFSNTNIKALYAEDIDT